MRFLYLDSDFQKAKRQRQLVARRCPKQIRPSKSSRLALFPVPARAQPLPNNWIAARPAPDPCRRRDGTRDDVAAFEPKFKVLGQIAGGVITRAWFAFQTFCTNCFQIAIERWRQGAQFRRGLLGGLVDHRQRVLAQKWGPAS